MKCWSHSLPNKDSESSSETLWVPSADHRIIEQRQKPDKLKTTLIIMADPGA